MIFVYARIFKVIHEREKYLKSHASYGASFTIPTKKKRQQKKDRNFGNIIKFKTNSNNNNSNSSNNEKSFSKQDDLKNQNNIPKNLQKSEYESCFVNSKKQLNENDDYLNDLTSNGLVEGNQLNLKNKFSIPQKPPLINKSGDRFQENPALTIKFMENSFDEINTKLSNINQNDNVNYAVITSLFNDNCTSVFSLYGQ